MKKTTLRQAALKLALVALVLLSPLGLRAQSLLFSEDFEGGSMPTGWTTDGSGTWFVATGDYSSLTGAGQGSYNAKIVHGSTGNVTKLITPEIDLSGAPSAVLSFMHVQRSWSGDIDQLRVYYRASSSASWTLLEGQVYTNAVSSWTTEEDIVLPNLSSTYQIAFEYTDKYGYGVGVDNIVITGGASCPKPGQITLGTAGATQYPISWTAGGEETSWNVYLTQEGSPVAGYNPLVVNTTPSCTFSGLTAGTTYDVAIEAICGSEVSAQRTKSFTTALCEASDRCEISIYRTDQYDDSWNGGSIAIMQNGNLVATVDCPSNLSGTTVNYAVCKGVPVSFVFTRGNYPGEIGVTITDGGGEVVYEATSMSSVSAGTFLTIDNACPSCYKVLNLTHSDETTDGVTLTWEADTRNDAGVVTYTIFNVTDNVVYASGVTATSQIVSGLNENTPYEFTVTTDCGSGDLAEAATVSFTTLASCPAPTATLTDNSVTAHGATIQWNDMGSTGYNVRWQVSNTITVDFESGSLPDGWTANTTSSSSGVSSQDGRDNSKCFKFHYSESGATLVSPVLSGTENGVNFSFYYRRYSDSYTEGFKVGYNTDGSDEFTYGDEISVTNTSSWLQYENAFPAGTKRIAIQYVYHNAYYLHIDDIDITIPNDNWTPDNTANTNYTITGLTADTRYLAQVQSVCGEDVSSWSEGVSFTTTIACPAPTGLDTVGDATANSVDLTWTAGAANQDTWQICLNGDETNLLDVTDATVTGTTVTYTLIGLTSGADYSVKVRANCGDVDGVSLQWSNTANFTTEASCTEPTAFAVVENSVEAHQAQLSWTAGGEETAWDIYYSNTNSAPVNGVTEPTIEGVTENNPYTLIGLTDVRTYYVWVRAHCGDAAGEQSPWVGPESFSTPQEAVTAPYADDFESGNNWLLVNGNLTNAWAYGEAVNNGGTHALYISNDGGANNTYNNGSAAMVYATKLFTFEEGTYKFSYDWKANGESTYDYLRVALVPATTTLTAGTSVPTGFSTTALPTGCKALDGGGKLNLNSDWQSFASNEMEVDAGTYMMVFAWRNDGSDGANPPAAIDNVSIEKITCIAPTALAASNVTAHKATLGWTAGADEEAWQIAYGTTADFDQDDVTPIDVTENPYLFENLTQSTHYYAYVRAKCGEDDYSNWSNMTDFTTISGKQAPTGLAVSDIASATATATWTGVATNELHESYDLYYSKLSSMPETLNEDSLFTGITTTTHNFANLESEVTYYVWVRDICGTDGESDWTSTSFTTLPSCPTPTALAATNITNNAATISWTGSSDVANYTVQYRTAEGMNVVFNEGFENGIGSWTLNNCHNSTGINTSANHSGNNGFRFYYSSNFPQYLISPELTLDETATLEFYYKNYSTSYPETFKVGFSSTNNGTDAFVWGEEVTASDIQWHLYSVEIPVNTKYMAIQYTSNDQYYLYIDDIVIGTPVPAGEWNDATEDVAAESFTIEGLEAETKYDVQVKSNCTNGEYSAPYTFTTASVFTKSIQANKWYAIATPAHDCVKTNKAVAVANVRNLTTAANDLYSYDEANGSWMAESDSLMRGTGYIYRSAAPAELGFVGYANTGNVSVSLTSSCSDNDLKGFNLIGNPYPHAVAINRDHYTLNANGSWTAKIEGSTIGEAEACLVYYSYASYYTTYSFSDVTPDVTLTSSKGNSANSALAFTVSNDEFEDVAYARFDNGEALPKIGHLNSEAPMLSIPVEGSRYAIANLGSDCQSFNLVFRGVNGTYTIKQSSNQAIAYCHLIDRVAGKEIDMLRQNYTFSSNGFDADRFMVKLSPDAQENANGNFAYWNGNSWMVEGNGTLQVFDALGRQLFSQEISNSNFEIQNSLFPAAGVYVLRMGEKTQKIVVR